MLIVGFFALVALASVLAFKDWRRGILLMLVIAALQDPVRKMLPGAPAFMVLCFFPVWLATFLGAVSGKERVFGLFKSQHPQIAGWMAMLIAAMIPGVLVTLQYGGSAWIVACLGLLSYMLPLSGLIIGVALMRDLVALKRFMMAYSVIAAVMLIGAPLEYFEVFPNWNALGTATLNKDWVRYISHGHTIKLHAGFYRSPDIMGWHAATLMIFSLTLFLLPGRYRAYWLGMAAWAGICLLISGRNKMIFMPMVWAVVMLTLQIRYGRVARLGRIAAAAGVALLSVGMIASQGNLEQDYFLHVSTGGDGVFERLRKDSLDTVRETYRQSGVWGIGIGSASQGRQHIDAKVGRGWQEGGLGKLIAELGLIGLVVVFITAFSIAMLLHRGLGRVPRVAETQLAYSAILGFVAANLACFVNSHLAFSDGGVVLLAAVMLGVAMSAPYWMARREAMERAPTSRGARLRIQPRSVRQY